MNACSVREESPAGLGYGAAALQLAPGYVLDRRFPGQQALTSLTFPIDFRLKYQPPDWVRRPDARAMAAVLPGGAAQRGQNGRALISCDVTREGTLRGCLVLEESPAGLGFGHAALGLAPHFQMSPPLSRGVFVPGQKVRVPIAWKLDQFNTRTTPTLANPSWIAAPTRAEMAAAYPASELAAGRGGFVQLFCKLDEEGRVGGCDIVGEEPGGRGYAKAARKLAAKFRVEPKLADGASVRGAWVRVPVRFSPTVSSAVVQIAKPEWGRLPPAEMVEASFPAAAKASGLSVGHATIDCRVVSGGAVENCTIVKETPAGMGFGSAALALAPGFRMKAWTSDGRPVDGARVRIPIRYEQ